MEEAKEAPDQFNEETALEQDLGKPLAEWSFPEFVQHDRSRRWYLIALAIVALGIIYSLISANFLFAFIIIMTVVVYYLHIVRTPETVRFAIYDSGVLIGHRFVKWKEVKKFWILYDLPEVKKLYFSFKSSLRPFLSIPLEKQNPAKLREILIKHLEEDLTQEDEPASEQWEKLLKL